ncbi:hypothetical protein CUMW_234050 [Citrus unshiu]|uniref:Leucine-rich repeat-containing N-terminal plant-type domain-containing protein n=1 Tax=Citrus unshiu TaxID=55188 RepID=A0A2H5QIP9_CITUN|nr:hypothetical protein CUMW_234050 [Citrus unshiu]
MGLSLTFFTFKHSVLFSFLIFHLAIGHFISSFQPLCHDHERSALLNFKESLVINRTASGYPSAYPKVASWKLDEKNSDCCLWDGVKCNEDTGHVVELDLASSCLYGSVNSTSSLFQLVHLQRLSLFDNNFNFSEIPSEILNFSRLTHLNLSRSYFSGQIPAELLELTNLEVLDLSFNTFDNFFLKLQKPGLANLAENLTNLKALDLINVFISSTVPHTLANLSSLRFLSLSGCHLQGEFPQEIFQLPNLQFLGVMINPNLTGYLPQFQKSSPLEDLRLSYTRFSGKIPDSIENLESLSYLGISHCSFVGKIPSSLGNLTKLEDLYLSGGSVPSSIFELRNLEELDLYFNNLSGTVDLNMFLLSFKRLKFSREIKCHCSLEPLLVPNTQKFEIIGLRSCNLSEFPSFLHNQDQLISLDLSSNMIAGKIPEWLFSAGEIPTSISNLKGLRTLNLSNNNLQGHIPPTLGNLIPLSPRSRLPFIPPFSGSGSPSWDSNCCIMGKRGISRLPQRFWGKRNYRDSVRSCFRFLGDGYRLGIYLWSVFISDRLMLPPVLLVPFG